MYKFFNFCVILLTTLVLVLSCDLNNCLFTVSGQLIKNLNGITILIKWSINVVNVMKAKPHYVFQIYRVDVM